MILAYWLKAALERVIRSFLGVAQCPQCLVNVTGVPGATHHAGPIAIDVVSTSHPIESHSRFCQIPSPAHSPPQLSETKTILAPGSVCLIHREAPRLLAINCRGPFPR